MGFTRSIRLSTSVSRARYFALGEGSGRRFSYYPSSRDSMHGSRQIDQRTLAALGPAPPSSSRMRRSLESFILGLRSSHARNYILRPSSPALVYPLMWSITVAMLWVRPSAVADLLCQSEFNAGRRLTRICTCNPSRQMCTVIIEPSRQTFYSSHRVFPRD